MPVRHFPSRKKLPQTRNPSKPCSKSDDFFAERSEADLGDAEAGDPERNADDRATEKNAHKNGAQPKPQSSKYHPDYIQHECTHAGIFTLHDRPAEREKRKLRDTETRNAVRNADDRAAENESRHNPLQPKPKSAEKEPQNISYKRHIAILSSFGQSAPTPRPTLFIIPHRPPLEIPRQIRPQIQKPVALLCSTPTRNQKPFRVFRVFRGLNINAKI